MISSITGGLPRFHENLHYVVLPFTVQLADGQLANFKIPNSSGSIVADFEKKGATPRKTTGPLSVVDGLANLVIGVKDATIQIEQGAAEPDLWPGVVLGAISVIGVETSGEVWAGRSTGVNPEDPTSLQFEFAKSSAPTIGTQLFELSKWMG